MKKQIGMNHPVTSLPCNPIRTWSDIRYDVPVPNHPLVPHEHWPSLCVENLTTAQTTKLNHLACEFMCEMFVHFERYIIDYIEKYKSKFTHVVSEELLDRFVQEEVDHTEAFYRLLELLNPQHYPTRKLRFLSWGFWDEFVIRFTPVSTFFLVAALFEEMTLFVPDVMEEGEQEAFAPILDVMRLHAKEEKSHIGIDRKILKAYRSKMPNWLFAFQSFLSLPIMLYVDKSLARAWKRTAIAFGKREGLSKEQIKKISKRSASTSDILGIQSFIRDQRKLGHPGSKAVCAILEVAL